MEQTRNPYAPTNVPLDVAEQPGVKPEEEREYGGFWVRVGAYLIDTVILIPLGILNVVGMFWSRNFAITSFALGMLVTAFYWIYLVRRYGGTPGKRLLSMRIALQDGSPVTMNAAILRYAPLFVLTAASSAASLIGLLSIPGENFETMGFLAKVQVYGTSMPPWGEWVGYVMWLWLLVTAVVMLCNDKRRALHDFIAGTVVLRER